MCRPAIPHPLLAPEGKPVGSQLASASFHAHIDLLAFFLTHRTEIVERIQSLLNAQRTPIAYQQDGPLLLRRFEECFFTLPGVTQSQARLRRELEDAHSASGFKPRDLPGLHNGPAEPSELMLRAFYVWRQTRWPGRNGRVRFAHTLCNLYVLRWLELLSLRIWDTDSDSADTRLADIQAVLDQLWSPKRADQPVLVRDARWLIQLAQCLATDDLGPYFDVAENVEALPDRDRLEVHRAGVRMTAGHLRSQIRYYCTKNGVDVDDEALILRTRTSNALDFAMLIQELVPLLDAYDDAVGRGDHDTRLQLADAICQGISPDPELFVNRVDLLRAYSMIEYLFTTSNDDGRIVYTYTGERHVRLLQAYETLIGRVAKPLHDDCRQFRPTPGAYSPYGVLYGFSSDLIKHMALKASVPDAMKDFGLEDVFVAGDPDKLAWVNGWRKLPHLTREMEALFEYPQQFAEMIFSRVENALRVRASEGHEHAAPAGRLFVTSDDGPRADTATSQIADLSVQYIESSDPDVVSAQRANYRDEAALLSDRREARCVLSYKTAGGWVAISKAMLTEVLGAGRDAKIVWLPPAATAVLMLTCPNLVVPGADIVDGSIESVHT